MTVNSRFENFSMTLPDKGPISVPDAHDFVANERTEIDLSQLVNNGWLDFISTVFIDNTQNSGHLIFECFGTNQRFPFPARASGYVSLFLPNPPKVFVTSSQSGNVTFQWSNTPVYPLVLTDPTGGDTTSDVNIAQVGGVALGGAFIPVSRIGSTFTDRSIANLSGISQALMAANAARTILVIQNIAANPIGVNLLGGVAAIGTAGTLTIPAGGSITLDNAPPVGAITIIGTATDDVTAYEG